MAAAIVVAPASAWACDEPSERDLGAVTAAAGDTVRFRVEGTDVGATWRATLADTELSAGTDDTEEPGTDGAFEVPNLGSSPRDEAVTISVGHEADRHNWELRLTLQYRPKTQTNPAPPPPKPSSPPAAPPPAASTRQAPPPVVTLPSRPAPSPARLVVDKGGARARSPAPAVRRAVRRLVQRIAHPRRKHHSKKARKKAKKHAKRARRKAARALRDVPAAAGPRDIPPSRDSRVDLSSDGFAGLGYTVAWKLLLAVALGGALLAVSLGTLARVRRRHREA